MFKDRISLPNGGELVIREEESGHYAYTYNEPREESKEMRRRWEWHKDHGTPHVHDYPPPYHMVGTRKTENQNIRKILEELREEFKIRINADELTRIIKDRRKIE